MLLFAVFVTSLGLAWSQYVVPESTVANLNPGISFSIPDSTGITRVSYHYNLNGSPLTGSDPGEYNYEIFSATNGYWIHENTAIILSDGQTVNYWVYVEKDGVGYSRQNQVWTEGPGDGVIAPEACTTYPCLIFSDDFNNLDLDQWQHELTAGGGGNWEFQYYTNNRSNSYVNNGNLYIKPTLTEDRLGAGSLSSGTLSLWGGKPSDVCTSNAWWGCERTGSASNYLNPLQSARLRTAQSFNFAYGRVEFRAKMPQGDWLWPAIWMLPKDDFYGTWPMSGEIDLVEARGNRNLVDASGNSAGIDQMGSAMHWGPFCCENGYENTHASRTLGSGTYGDSFHTYRLDWDENAMVFTVDGEVLMTVDPGANGFFSLGGWDQRFGAETNPWVHGNNKMAPFDKEFFLIMNVAVGGTNGFFSDSLTNSAYPKPWINTSPTAPKDFWLAKDSWYPTWIGDDAAMQVDYVKVWKLKA